MCKWHLTGKPILTLLFPSWETLSSPSPPCWSAVSMAVLFEGGELPAEELLHVRPNLVGFRTREGLQDSFTPAGERVKTLVVYSACRKITKPLFQCLIASQTRPLQTNTCVELWLSSFLSFCSRSIRCGGVTHEIALVIQTQLCGIYKSLTLLVLPVELQNRFGLRLVRLKSPCDRLWRVVVALHQWLPSHVIQTLWNRHI